MNDPSWNSDARPSLGFFPVAGRARYSITGPDAARYLNGQISIDVHRLASQTARPACLLTAKGKLCAVVWVLRTDDGFLIECDASLAETVGTRLERYLVSDNACLERAPTPSPWFHVLGPAPADGLSCARLGLPGFDTATPPAAAPLLSTAACEALRIRHGWPAWGAELDEDSLPQEAGLEETAVDFDKGCYVGQETVSRLQSVGRVNHRLHGFRATIALRPGLQLTQIDSSDSPAGHLTSTSSHFGIASTIALGYLHRSFDTTPRFLVRDEHGQPLGEVERHAFPIP